MKYTDPTITVFKELPEGRMLVDAQGHITDWAKAHENPNLVKPEYQYYYCRRCEGYINGKPGCQSENSIGPLAGRCGRSYYCGRCGKELLFVGYMS